MGRDEEIDPQRQASQLQRGLIGELTALEALPLIGETSASCRASVQSLDTPS